MPLWKFGKYTELLMCHISSVCVVKCEAHRRHRVTTHLRKHRFITFARTFSETAFASLVLGYLVQSFCRKTAFFVLIGSNDSTSLLTVMGLLPYKMAEYSELHLVMLKERIFVLSD